MNSQQKSKFALFYQFEKNKQGEEVAVCRECKEKKKINKVIKRKSGNTTGLKKHLKMIHPRSYQQLFGESSPKMLPGQQSLLVMMQSEDSKKSSLSTKELESLIVNWMAVKNLPFSFFDDEATQNFFFKLNPTITMPHRNAARRMVLNQFRNFQANVKNILQANNSNISFTVDGWTSMNLKSYYGITVHFIDNEWKMQSFALDFVASRGAHSGKAIARVFFDCLKEYNLEGKIQGITVDNVSANTTFMSELSILFKHSGQCQSFDNINQHFRCFAHILNLGVQDVMKLFNKGEQYSESGEDDSLSSSEELSDDEEYEVVEETDEQYVDSSNNLSPHIAIKKLRTTFVRIRRSEQMQTQLKSFCSASNCVYVKPILDVKTRWNSTFEMINAGLRLQNGLHLLWVSCKELKHLMLSDEEWSLLTQINSFLKNFKIVSDMISGEKYVTLPLVIVAFNMLLSKIEQVVLKLDNKLDRSTVDEVLILAFQAARDKLLKHYKKTNWVYCACLVLDPRHKIETFELTTWGREMMSEAISQFETMYKQKYSNEDLLISDENLESNITLINENDEIDIGSIYEERPKNNSWDAEYKQYTEQPRVCKDQMILPWWQVHENTFPTLAKMAKDLFSISATSVPVERLFSRASAVMRKHRLSLNDESVRALLCLNSWVSCDLKDKISAC